MRKKASSSNTKKSRAQTDKAGVGLSDVTQARNTLIKALNNGGISQRDAVSWVQLARESGTASMRRFLENVLGHLGGAYGAPSYFKNHKAKQVIMDFLGPNPLRRALT